MTEFNLNLMGHNSLHSLSIRDVFELCMTITNSITSYAEYRLFMGKSTERSQLERYYTRLKWNMSVLERAISQPEDARNNVKILDITLKYRNKRREMSEVKVELNPESFQITGPSALSKILSIVSKQTIRFLRDKQLMTPRIKTAPNVILTDKCSDLFELVALCISNNISTTSERSFDIKKDTVFSSLDIRVVVNSRRNTTT